MVDVAEQGDMRRDSGMGQRMATDEEEAAMAILSLSQQPLAPSPGPAKCSKRKANKIETCETLDSEAPAAEEHEKTESSALSARHTFLQQVII